MAMSFRESYDDYYDDDYYLQSPTHPPPSWPPGPHSVAQGRAPPYFGHPSYPSHAPSHPGGPVNHSSRAPLNRPRVHPHPGVGPPLGSRPGPPHSHHASAFDMPLPPPPGPRRPRPQSGTHPPPSVEIDVAHYQVPPLPHGSRSHPHAPRMPRNSDPALPHYYTDHPGASAPSPGHPEEPEAMYQNARQPPTRALTPPQSVYSMAHAPPPQLRLSQGMRAPPRGQGPVNYPPLTRATTEYSYRRPTAAHAVPDRRGPPAQQLVPVGLGGGTAPPVASAAKPRRRNSASAYLGADDASAYSVPGYSKTYREPRGYDEYYAAPQSEYGSNDLYNPTTRHPGRASYPNEISPTWDVEYTTRRTAPALGKAITDGFNDIHPPPHTYAPPDATGSYPPPAPRITAPPTMGGGFAPPQAVKHAPHQPKHAPPQFKHLPPQSKHAPPQLALPQPLAPSRPRRNSSRSYPALCTLPRVPSPGASSSDGASDNDSENGLGLPTRPPSPADGPSKKAILREVGWDYPEPEPINPRRLRLRSRSCATNRSRSRFGQRGLSRSMSRPRLLHPSGAASSYGEFSRSRSRFRSEDSSRDRNRYKSVGTDSFGERSRSVSRYRSATTSRSPSRGRSGYGSLHERNHSRHASAHPRRQSSHHAGRHVSRHTSGESSRPASRHSKRHVNRHANANRHTSRHRSKTSTPGTWPVSDDESAVDTESSTSDDDYGEEETSESEAPKYKGFEFDGIEEIDSTISGHGNGHNKPVPLVPEYDDDDGYDDYGRGEYKDFYSYKRPGRSTKKTPKASVKATKTPLKKVSLKTSKKKK